MTLIEKIKIVVEVGCQVSSLFTNTVIQSPVEYTIGDQGFNLNFLFEQTSTPAGC